MRDFGEAGNLVQLHHAFAVRQTSISKIVFEVMMTDVIGAPLEQRCSDRHAQGITHRRQITVVELILQRLGASGYDDLGAGQQCGHEIGHGLSRAGASLAYQCR